MKNKWLFFKIWLLTSGLVTAQDQVTYIRQFQDIAIAEMLRTGIPASIKLAQAILESNCGKSDLACKANNHFGIKCGSNWNGKSFHKEDDDYEEGKLVKSCFREFNSVMESYIAHSDFLTDPGKSGRYGFLFNLRVTDYEAWARGLSSAGYATDPQYANRLISIIEKYELFRFDNEHDNPTVSVSPPTSAGYAMVRYNNDVKYASALVGDNPMIIAHRYDMSVAQILRYNENISEAEQPLEAGSKIYLQPKRSKYHGKQTYHIMKEREDMMMLSQMYGIKLDALLKRNGLKENQIPAPKQKVMLKGKAKQPPKVLDAMRKPLNNTNPEKKEKESKPAPVIGSLEKPKSSADSSTASATKPASSQEPGHTVSKGETLYGIARNYGLSVDELKKRNNLSADTIFIGQKLVLK